jgi:hypothetical protein
LISGVTDWEHFTERLSFDFDGSCGPVENLGNGSSLLIDLLVLELVLRHQELIPGLLDRNEVVVPVTLFTLFKVFLSSLLCVSPAHDCVFGDSIE